MQRNLLLLQLSKILDRGDFMAKKIAGQAGGLVTAGGEVSCPDDLTFDYTKLQQDLQEDISSRFAPKKVQSRRLASVYRSIGLLGRYKRVFECGSFLEFGFTAAGEKKLLRASFCRDRLCPYCNWRRSLKVYSQVSQVMDVLEASGLEFIFLTFTVRNCPSAAFPATIDALLAGWYNLYHHCRPVIRICKGSVRALEVTVNQERSTYHPHLHVVLAVDPEYFTGKDYLTQADWTRLWQAACNLSYRPIVDVRKVVDLKDGFKEVAKYAVKGSDFLVGSPAVMKQHVQTFLAGLSGRRLCGFTGCFSKVRKALNLDDPETGDLVVTDGQQLRSDLCTMIVRYQWRSGVYVRL